ncbi:MAG: DUF2975 domain-containing protein [Rhizomicrobium sp.]
MADQSTSNLVWLSRVMAWLSTIGLVLSPLLDVVAYAMPGARDSMNFDADHMGQLLNDGIPLPYRLAALAFSLSAELFTVWALWSLRALFLIYARGEVFSPRALKLLHNVAVALFAGVIVTFVVHAPISLILTLPLGAGHHAISLDLGSGDVATLFLAGAVLAISRVMVEAGRIAEENAKFV